MLYVNIFCKFRTSDTCYINPHIKYERFYIKCTSERAAGKYSSKRQSDRENRAFFGDGGNVYAAAAKLCDPRRKSQTQTVAIAFAGGIRLIKFVEYAFKLFIRHADAVVAILHTARSLSDVRETSIFPCSGVNFTAFERIFIQICITMSLFP